MLRVAFVLMLGAALFADEVRLKNGDKLTGVVREVRADALVVETAEGFATVARSEVAAVDRSVSSDLNVYDELLSAARTGADFELLTAWAKRAGLARCARDAAGRAVRQRKKEFGADPTADQLCRTGVWALLNERHDDGLELLQQALKIDPEHERAREVLGYRLVNGRWAMTGVALIPAAPAAAPEIPRAEPQASVFVPEPVKRQPEPPQVSLPPPPPSYAPPPVPQAPPRAYDEYLQRHLRLEQSYEACRRAEYRTHASAAGAAATFGGRGFASSCSPSRGAVIGATYRPTPVSTGTCPTCNQARHAESHGNNGLGNGLDPQPRGNPRPNDAPTAVPGRPNTR